MTYQEFVKLVDQTSNNFDWRYGQALMNVLHGVWPEKYNQIVDSDNDPYYRDDNVPRVLKLLSENWKPTK
jgi:ribonuclease I